MEKKKIKKKKITENKELVKLGKEASKNSAFVIYPPKEKEIPTAEEIYNDFYFNYKGDGNSVLEAMKHFAKLHLIAQTKTINENAFCESLQFDELTGEPIYTVNKESILKAYPLENVK